MWLVTKVLLMPKVQEAITMLHMAATCERKVSWQLSFAPNEKLICAGMDNCSFETVDMAEFRAML